jgi:TonB-linked SusC/RagA family outer membrane protein
MKKLLYVLCRLLLIVLSVFVSQLTFAQSSKITVTGKVSDDHNNPLSGVTVQVKGNKNVATTTSNEGLFTLPVDKGNETLVFSFVGYAMQEIELKNRTQLSITMQLSSKSLEDVVVVGYGTRRRGDVTGAISSIKTEQLEQVPTTNVTQALQGRIAGIEATNSSFRPGSGARIRVRGNRSLTPAANNNFEAATDNARNGPLYVVDGIPITYSIDDINPLDIESIDVLKDASATAIYGSRGANGVIQITTKKGKAGKIGVQYSGSVSFDRILKRVESLSGPQYADMKRQSYFANASYDPTQTNGGATFYFPDPASDYTMFRADPNMWESIAMGYDWIRLDPAAGIFHARKRATTDDEKDLLRNLGLSVLDSIAMYDPGKVRSFNWQDRALRTGITQNHQIQVSGGSDKFRASFSGAYFNQKGIEYGQDYTRFTFSQNTDYKVNNRINVGGGITYTSAIQNTGPSVYGRSIYQIPLALPYDADGNLIFNPGGDPNIVNPLNDPNTVFDENRINRLLANVFGEVEIIKGLKYRAAFGSDYSNVRRGTFNGSQSSAQQGNPANASYTTRLGFNWVLDNILTYNKRFGSDHSVTITALQELQKTRFEENIMRAESLIYESQKWYSLQNNSMATVTGEGKFTQTQLLSFMGRINYAYKDRYILTLSQRNDNSSVLSEGSKGEWFPSAALAWRIDQENFMAGVPVVNELKLRVGYGAVGSSSIDPYLTRGTLTRSSYNFGTTAAQGYAPSTLPLPDLSWERTTTQNIALDFAVLKNRIRGAVDLYQSNTTNQLQSQSIPGASGYTSVLVNIGEVRNKGIEVTLSTVNINNPNGLRWTTDFIFSKNKESIVSLDGTGNNNIGNQWFVGHPIQTYYDWKSLGIYQYSDTMKGGVLADYFWTKASNKSSASFRPGRVSVADANGDTLINDFDKVIIGSPNADWTGSINSTWAYKGFELSVYFYMRKGSIIRDIRPSLNGRYQSNNVDYWTPQNPSNKQPQPNRTVDIYQYWQANGFRDGTFARIRSISLSYAVPAAALKRVKVSNCTVYVNALNPFLFSKFKGFDPESGSTFLSSYPTSRNDAPGPTSYSYRSFVLGVRLGL